MLRLLLNSLEVSGATALCATAAGFFAAVFAFGLQGIARKLLWTAAVVALVLPPFLVVNCWLHFFGLNGSLRGVLPLNLYSATGVVWILTLLYWPIPFVLTLSAWRKIETAQLESEPRLMGLALVRWLLWPAARASIAQGATIVFVLALNHFAVPAILQVKVYPAEVWLRLSAELDYRSAFLMSLPAVIITLLLVLVLRSREVDWPQYAANVPPESHRKRCGYVLYWTCALLALVIVFFAVAFPVGELLSGAQTWRELPKVLAAVRPVILTSLFFAAGGATICLVAAMASHRWPIGPVLWLLFLLPGVLLGALLIKIFNRPVLDLIYSGPGIVLIALSIHYAALAWGGVRKAMRTADARLGDVVRLHSGSRWDLFRYARWPQIAPVAASVWMITYLLCLWDAESVIMIQPPGGETLALRVFNLLHYGHIGQVNALCLVLLALAVAPAAFWTFLKRVGFSWLAIAFFVGCSPARKEAEFRSQFFSAVEIIGHRGAGIGELNKPRSVAVDREDNLYVVDMTGRVQKFSPRGEFLLSWQMPQTDKGKPKGMCRDKDGNIVVLEPHYSRVNHYTPQGSLAAQWGTHGTNAGELAFPRSVAVNSHGNIFVSEYGLTERVQCFSSDGKTLLFGFGSAGDVNGQFNRAEGLGIDSQDRVYVADSCNHRVQIFSADGKWIASYGQPGNRIGEMSYPYDVRVDALGFQYVCEFGNSRIQVFDRQNKSVEVIGGPGIAPGLFNNPWSIALDSQGNLYVADAGNHRVQKLVRRREITDSGAEQLAGK